MKRTWKLILFFMLTTSVSFSQMNLIPNPSFEDFDTCPKRLGMLLYSTPWFRPTIDMINTFNDGTSDYFNECFDTVPPWYNNMDIPNNYFGYQYAKSGSAYAGIITYYWNIQPLNYKEYIEVKFNSPLITGTKYYVSFYVSMADSCQFATDNLGAYLSMDSILSNNYLPLSYVPQILNPIGSIIADRLGWTLIAGMYVAQGGEQFITIGNFQTDANTDTVFIPGGGFVSPDYKSSYLYIDDVCISSDSMTCVNFASGISPNFIESLKVYPNPTKDIVFIEIKDSCSAIVSVFDCIGKEIIRQKLNSKKTEIKLFNLDDGAYILKIFLKDQILTKKILVIK